MPEHIVRSWDIDDTVVNRGVLLRAFGLAAHKSGLSPSAAPETLDSVPRLEHGAIDTPIESLRERLFLQAHMRRALLPGVEEALAEIETTSDVNINVVNSGRSNKREWADMTLKQLARLGVGRYFSEFNFKPKGVSSTESKLDVIRSYVEKGAWVEHFEDDPRTSLEIARLFPDVKVNLLSHRITGMMIPLRTLAQYPNLYVVTRFEERRDM